MFQTSRRGFLQGVAGATALGVAGCGTVNIARRPLAGQKIRLAAVGIMGKGFSDWMPMLKSGLVEIVAFCDADARKFKDVLNQKEVKERGYADMLSKVPFFTDYREMLDKVGSRIDAMTVSTPDHMHAAIAVTAMRMGIHVYVQKPLVRTLWEAEVFGKTARECGVVTQMGNQGSGGNGFRRNVEIIQSGILGDVTEVHVWTNRPVWPQGKGVCDYVRAESAKGGHKIPEGLNWDAWLGVAEKRPFLDMYPDDAQVYDPWKLGKHVYHPFTWRGFFDFGAGAFGDMACHTMNLPFRGLELGRVLDAECTMIDSENAIAYPLKSVVRLTYAERESNVRKGVKLPAVKLFWYDGREKPSADLMPAITAMPDYNGKVPDTGCLLVGTNGILCSCADYGQEAFIALKGEKVAKNVNQHEACSEKNIAKRIPRCQGAAAGGMDTSSGAAALSADGHYIEFLTAILERGAVYDETASRCYSDVEYSIPMMDAILVGTVAQRIHGKLSWCSKRRRFHCGDGCCKEVAASANALVKPYLREGYRF